MKAMIAILVLFGLIAIVYGALYSNIRKAELASLPIPEPKILSTIDCGNLEVTINGTDFLLNEKGVREINGTYGDDIILGTEGPDRIRGFGGNDIICAGSGDDRVYAGAGNDIVFGEDGDDRLSGGRDNDVLDGGNGDDSVSGDEGVDLLKGGGGRDRLNAGEGEGDKCIVDEEDRYDKEKCEEVSL